jgi:hypothetical protein
MAASESANPPAKKKSKFSCASCSFGASKLSDLKSHVARVHNSGRRGSLTPEEKMGEMASPSAGVGHGKWLSCTECNYRDRNEHI